METAKAIITKSGQRFEAFSSLEEALAAIKSGGAEGYNTTLLIEYEGGEEYIKYGSFIEGEYRETGIKTLLFNPDKGVVQMYGEYRIADEDSGEEYTPDKDTPDRLWNASARFHFVYPSYLSSRTTRAT